MVSTLHVSSTANTVKPVKVHQSQWTQDKASTFITIKLCCDLTFTSASFKFDSCDIRTTFQGEAIERRPPGVLSRTQRFFQPRKVHVIIEDLSVSIKIKKSLRISGTCTTVTIFRKNLSWFHQIC